MNDIDCDPSDSLQAKASLRLPHQPLSVSRSEPYQAAHAFLRSRLTSVYDTARALGAAQVATNRQNGTRTAR